MNPFIDKIYATREVVGISGRKHDLTSEIDPGEGEFIQQLISADPSIAKTLEVGCAYGLSSLYICHSLRSRDNAEHIIIDPFQYADWDGCGIKGLTSSGIDFFRWIEQPSELALPDFLARGETDFDFIFIDGWHTFDHTLLDCFYATRLLKVGGYLVIDDVGLLPVRRAVDYISLYPCYEMFARLSSKLALSARRKALRAMFRMLLPLKLRRELVHPIVPYLVDDDEHPRMLAFKKISGDQRPWNWYPRGF